MAHTLNSKLWKLVATCVPRHTTLGRIIRSRRIKPTISDPELLQSIIHTRSVLEPFDPQTNALFLGSSHILDGIVPATFTTLRGWNGGFISGDFSMALQVYRALRGHWPQEPGQLVVLGDDFWMGAHICEYSIAFYQTILLHLFTQLPYRSNFLIAKHEQYIKAFIETHKTILDEAVNAAANKRGHTPGGPNYAQEPNTASRIGNHYIMTHFIQSENSYQQTLRQEVEADGRQLIMLRLPVRPDYLETLATYKEDVWRATAPTRIGVPLLDHFETAIPDDGWADIDHLSESGAQWFTQHIEPELLQIIGGSNAHN